MSFVTIPTAGAAAGTSDAGAVCGSSTRGDFIFGVAVPLSGARGPTESDEPAAVPLSAARGPTESQG